MATVSLYYSFCRSARADAATDSSVPTCAWSIGTVITFLSLVFVPLFQHRKCLGWEAGDVLTLLFFQVDPPLCVALVQYSIFKPHRELAG